MVPVRCISRSHGLKIDFRDENFKKIFFFETTRSTQRTSWSVPLNVSYHKKNEYAWLRGGDLNGFRDIKSFMKLKGG